MKIRMKFSKQGPLKFVGHLDLLRYFQKVMRKADVDIRYSEGFSPHQIMSFASPLGVGLVSNGEYVDIEVSTSESSETMIARINSANAEGFTVTSYRKLPDGAKNAMSLVAAADYKMWFKDGYAPADPAVFFAELGCFLSREKIDIIKQTKKGEKALDLKDYLYEYTVNGDSVFMKLAAGSSSNIKPELVLTAYYESAGKEYPVSAFQIEREEVYADEGSGSVHQLVPLLAYGEDIE